MLRAQWRRLFSAEWRLMRSTIPFIGGAKRAFGFGLPNWYETVFPLRLLTLLRLLPNPGPNVPCGTCGPYPIAGCVLFFIGLHCVSEMIRGCEFFFNFNYWQVVILHFNYWLLCKSLIIEFIFFYFVLFVSEMYFFINTCTSLCKSYKYKFFKLVNFKYTNLRITYVNFHLNIKLYFISILVYKYYNYHALLTGSCKWFIQWVDMFIKCMIRNN